MWALGHGHTRACVHDMMKIGGKIIQKAVIVVFCVFSFFRGCGKLNLN